MNSGSGDFRRWRAIAAVCVAAAVVSLAAAPRHTPADAQTPAATGQVIGVVTDLVPSPIANGSHGPLAGVTVALSGPALPQPRVTRTDGRGQYQFKDLPPGTYGLYFGVRGYHDFMQGDIVVKDGGVVQVMAALDSDGSERVDHVAGLPLRYGQTRVELHTELGDIQIIVDGERAPITTQNFLKYVTEHFYDGGDFHRTTRPDNYTMLLPNRPMMRIIQGGINPARRSAGFPPITLERTSVTKIAHHRGTVSMARGAADTATSDFFICLDDQPSLDFGGKRFDDAQGAAAFGTVDMGLDVVEKINLQPAQGQNLAPPIKILSAAVVK